MPQLIEVLEFFDNSGNTLVKRVPEFDNTEIKWGAQLTVRESQIAIFFKDGKAVETFEPGRYILNTKNIPVLTKLVTGLVYGKNSPFRAEVYFLNLKIFRDFKWGTGEPILYKDTEFDMIRLRANGQYSIKLNDPKLFLNKIVGTQGYFTDSEISSHLKSIIISHFTSILGNELDTIFNLPKRFIELGNTIKKSISNEFNGIGLELFDFHLNSISLPQEVQKSIDAKSGMKAVGDLNDFLKFSTAKAVEKSTEKGGAISEGLSAGLGIGLGINASKNLDNSQNKLNTSDEIFDKIKKLKELLDIQAITKEDFESTKNKLLNQIK